MSWLLDISFLRPFWGFGVLLVLGLAVVSMRRNAALGDWVAQIDPHLLRAMRALGKVDGTGSRGVRYVPFWSAALICVALSGPALERGNGQTFRNLDGVIFVVDVSPSVTRDARWDAALTMARAGVSVLGSKPAGLIVYAGDSYRAAALTLDHLQLAQSMALLDDATVPDRGSRPALALGQAGEMLAGADILAGDVVLLSDGGGFGPETLNRAREIAALGGRLLLVRIASTVSGKPPVARAAFDALAALGGGQVFELGEIEPLMEALGETAQRRLEKQEFQLLFWSDYGRYLMLLALIPLAALFRRERV